MKLYEKYQGADDPFEGDLTLWLRSVPIGARVIKAVVKLKPVTLPGGTLFEETITFTDGQEDLGAIKITGTTLTSDFVEVDFHTRHTLVAVVGTGHMGRHHVRIYDEIRTADEILLDMITPLDPSALPEEIPSRPVP